MKRILLAVLALVTILACILLFNTFTLSSKQIEAPPVALPEVPDSAYEHLAGAIRFPTISYSEDAVPDSTAFYGFHRYLEKTYPLIHANLQKTLVHDYSLLYTWSGTDPKQLPVILMSHQDVVPVDQPTLEKWEAGPFEGAITETEIIGRGTLDDKSSLIAVMESVEKLLAEGYKPARTFYLAFGHDEEVGGGNGASYLAKHLKEMGVHALLTLDEGGYIAEGMVPGVDQAVAFINLAEKGFSSFRLIVETNGGHSSNPPRENTIGMLAQAIVDLENNQLPYKLVNPVDYQLEYLGPELPFTQRLAFANPWLFKGPILKGMNAHTTTAPTIIEGGVKNNVIPTVAEATINFRILPGETIESVQAHIESVVNPAIRVEPVGFLTNPSPVSSVDSEGFKTLEHTIRSLFPGTVVIPGLVGGGTDARYFYEVSDDVYRFYPVRMGAKSMERFHGIDEKISKSNFDELIGFTYQFIKNLD
ncbi:MAG: hypothetical protein RLZZ241_420 [Bacteroidota bacterium]|jgi:carboxypeptidase PM20D1